ncbi:MAG: L,D-transpeptidase [Pseudolabrys sp.]|nr:L,D-transpeptidase [Pseudolabrys sp.]
MSRLVVVTLAVLCGADAALAQSSVDRFDTDAASPMTVAAATSRANLGGGFIEFLLGGAPQPTQRAPSQPAATWHREHSASLTPEDAVLDQPWRGDIDPKFLRQEVPYRGKEQPGTIVIDTPNHFLYLVEPDGKAIRYGVGVGRPGFTWSGTHRISAMKEWPDWVPPKDMLARQPGLPHFMAGGPHNPLGARALYLGSTLYRIHGSNEPWTIGRNVSSGCIRMRNADVIDLYARVKVGTKVVVF